MQTHIFFLITISFIRDIGIEVKVSWKICDWTDTNYIDKNKYRKR